MRGLLPGVFLALMGLASVSAANPTIPPLERLLHNDFEVLLPVHACTVPAMIANIARRHEVPAGIEFPQERCPSTPSRTPATPVVHLGGMTVKAAFDKLITLDRRFRWVDADGVAIVRPVNAWGDEKNVLNFVSGAFEVKDANLDQALSAVVSALQTRPRDALGDGVRSTQGMKLFSVKTGPVSVGEALDAIVRAHGEGWWELSHFIGSDRMRVMGFHTFDGSFVRALIAAEPR